MKADFDLELQRQLAVHFTGRSDAVPNIEMRQSSPQKEVQVQIDTMSKNDMSLAGSLANSRMGTRKNNINFGRNISGPNFI